jgi:hypothetical protein
LPTISTICAKIDPILGTRQLIGIVNGIKILLYPGRCHSLSPPGNEIATSFFGLLQGIILLCDVVVISAASFVIPS